MSDDPFPSTFYRFTSSFGRRGRTGMVQTWGHEWRYQIQAPRFRARVRLSEMSDAQRATFITFFNDHVGDTFLFTEPITSTVWRVRFMSDAIDVSADFYQQHSTDFDMIEAE